MIYAQLGKYRIATIFKFSTVTGDFKEQDVLYGLHLETCAERQDGTPNWFAIAGIHYDDKNETYNLETVGDRFMKALMEDQDSLEDINFLINYAYRTMRKAYKEAHPDEF